MEFTPKEIVAELDKYIIGQESAKRAVAVALRNRYRRLKLPDELAEEVVPKNILMIGPTGVGKTEIARRLSRLANAPFIKVEATKFTEVGYVGRDVESMIRDLLRIGISMVETEKMVQVEEKARVLAEERLLDLLAPLPRSRKAKGPFDAFLQLSGQRESLSENEEQEPHKREQIVQFRQEMEDALKKGELEEQLVELETEDRALPVFEIFTESGVEELGVNFQDVLGDMMPKKKVKKRLPVKKARQLLIQEEARKLLDHDEVVAEAIHRVETSGIVFLDEIDKIAQAGSTHGPDVSREGVQRDILPVVEGSTVMTKYGPVKTDHILFIAAGAFHTAKPSDLIPELQGRFPIRVELSSLTDADFSRILTEPQNALIKQYQALLATEGVTVDFTDEAIKEISSIARLVNERTEDIGARRLHTIMEKLLEELSFAAPDLSGQTIRITKEYVVDKLGSIVADQDLSRYVL
ncbi:MAG: ATP-dependent protease ATPase subunit HslU [Limnochordia bacterium]|nr:ATP-dependent protease ATPase subunit HslU [Limnochordia bacterium]